MPYCSIWHKLMLLILQKCLFCLGNLVLCCWDCAGQCVSFLLVVRFRTGGWSRFRIVRLGGSRVREVRGDAVDPVEWG